MSSPSGDALSSAIDASQSGAILSSLVNALEDHGFLLIDPTGVIRWANHAVANVLGYDPAELAGQPLPVLYRQEDDGPREAAAHLRAALAGERVRAEGWRRRSDGAAFWAVSSFTQVSAATGKVIVCSIVDITERKRAEDQFRLAVEAAPNAMLMVDASGTIVLVNTQTERLFGYSREELVGKNMEMLLPAEVRGNHAHYRAAFHRHPGVRPMGAGRDLFGMRKDGVRIPIEIGLNPIETKEGLFVLSAIVDITERKRAEEELRRSHEDLQKSNRDLESFAYIASHDLQEPLRMVSTFVELLAMRYRGKFDESGEEYLHFAEEGALRAQRLIRELLEYSRIGTSAVRIGPVNVDQALTQALYNLRLAVQESSATIERGALPVIEGDEAQLARLFQNLIENAIKYRGESPPRLRVSAEDRGREVLFSVADNGIGIDPRYFEKIFGIFQRLHGRDAYPGTGIGLAVCKRIVERHGGRIWVDSTPGQGATFSFTVAKEQLQRGRTLRDTP